jgi:hypothetical protein
MSVERAPPLEFLSRTPAPQALDPPAYCVTVGERVHAVALDPGGAASRHLAVDADGAAEALAPLPVAVGGVAANGAELLVTGWDAARRPAVLTVDDAGAVTATAAIPFDGVPLLFPRPVGGRDGVGLVALSDPEQPRLWRAPLTGGTLGKALVVPLRGTTIEADVAAVPGGLALARVLDRPSRLEIARVGDDRGVSALALPLESPLSPVLAAVPGGLLLLALSSVTGTIELFPLDARARPSLPGRRLAGVAPARSRTGGLIARHGRVAVTWRSGDVVEDIAATLAVVGPGGEVLAAPAPVEPAGALREAGGWLGDRLVLLHGGETPEISVYELR